MLMDPKCQGCLKALDTTLSVGLPGGWSLNHYGSPEGFFGWLALQTTEHRLTLCDLSRAEVESLGPTLQKLEKGIYEYWLGQSIEVARVYMLYLLEGQLEPGHQWHLHIHLVPRFKILESSMKSKPDVLGSVTNGIDAYLIAKLRPGNATYKLPPELDRQSLTESDRQAKEIAIVRGIVEAAGFGVVWGESGSV